VTLRTSEPVATAGILRIPTVQSHRHSMTKTYEQLTQEIEALQEQAAAVLEEEKRGVVARIKVAIAFYGLTAEDLGFGIQARAGNGASTKAKAPKTKPPKPAQKAAKKRPSAVKYRDDAGHSWTGMGPMPGWLKAALAAGQSLDALTVGAKAGEPVPKPAG
jgi:DNA-binding protein H-NS